MPKEGQEAANLTQDYTNSPLHRFKKPGSKNFQVKWTFWNIPTFHSLNSLQLEYSGLEYSTIRYIPNC